MQQTSSNNNSKFNTIKLAVIITTMACDLLSTELIIWNVCFDVFILNRRDKQQKERKKKL